MAITDYGWEEAIWNALVPFYDGNEYAAAGTMGNWFTESYLVPFQRENDTPAGSNSKTYTANVDNGTVTRAQFITTIKDSTGKGPGYGLAQWTSRDRKIGMYDHWNTDNWRGAGISIGSLNYNMEWFGIEMNGGYSRVYAGMKAQTSATAASDYFLRNFEGIWNSSYINRRAQAEYYYKKYAGTDPGPTPPDPPDPPTPPPDPPDPQPPTPAKVRKMKIMYYLRRKF